MQLFENIRNLVLYIHKEKPAKKRLAGNFIVSCSFHCSEMKLPHRGSAAALTLLGEPTAPCVTWWKVARGTAWHTHWHGEVEEDKDGTPLPGQLCDMSHSSPEHYTCCSRSQRVRLGAQTRSMEISCSQPARS